MRPAFRPAIRKMLNSRTVWLAALALSVCGWAWVRGEPDPGRGAVNATTIAAAPRALPVPVVEPAPVQAAALGVATIEVIVSRNDTLDRIFRRLKLDLADLATMRGLPGIKAG